MKLHHGETAGRIVSGRIGEPTATTTSLKAVPANSRVDGQLFVVLNDYSVWVYDADSAASASSTVLVPDAGDGRFLAVGISAGTTGVVTVSKSVGYAAISDAGTTKTIDFDAALPAGACVVGAGANVTAIFDNAGDTASVTFDLGIKSGDTDGFVDGGSLNAVAKVGVPAGAALGALCGAITPSIIFDGSVNLDTLTKGAAVFYVSYVVMF
jgi:hypothetical protein